MQSFTPDFTAFVDRLAPCTAGRIMVRAKQSPKTSPRTRLSRKTTGRSRQPTHPSWTEMITECITTTPDGTQNGVSRPTLKKFVEFNYQLVMSATTTSQLNRAITAGTEKGNFVLPKGPSGKVKLAPERTIGTSKEPASKRPPSAKATTVTLPRKTATATKQYTSRAKKGRSTSTSAAGRKVAKKLSTKRAAAKKDITGTSRPIARGKTLRTPTVSSPKSRRRASAK
ncbi:histone H1 [Pisolithus marmoratus]|nr:histone H1 [Pisolithus marmoratus]